MAKLTARSLVEKLLAERQGSDMRFDLDCRVEVWVTADDIEDDRRARAIANGPGTLEEKIAALKNLAQTLAADKLAEVRGVQLTCDGLDLSSVNVDRIEWHTLAQSDAEKQAAEAEDNAAFERRFPPGSPPHATEAVSARSIIEARFKPPVLYHGGERFDRFDDTAPEFRVKQRSDGWALQQRVGDDWIWRGSPPHATEAEARQALSSTQYPGTIYATDDIDAASSYAGQFAKEQAEIKALRMRLKNPLDLRDPAAFQKWIGYDVSNEQGDRQQSTMAQSNSKLRSGGNLLQKIKDAGYDGIIFYDTDNLNRGAHTSYVAFRSDQVRPAKHPTGAKQWWGYPVRNNWGRKSKTA